MYVNPAFRTSDETAWEYVTERGFGAVVAIDDGQPVASQVPLLVKREGDRRTIEFHVARANPLHAIVARSPRVLVVVSGPDAYISPDWYTSADQVPTWNYLAAHISGLARPMPPERALAHVEAMSLFFEERLRPKKPWSTAKMTEAKRQAMLRAIVPIEVEVERIEASTKLSQNKSASDRLEAARMLAWRGGWNEAAVAEAMREVAKANARIATGAE
jgi:transcriptional regulator